MIKKITGVVTQGYSGFVCAMFPSGYPGSTMIYSIYHGNAIRVAGGVY